MKFKNGDTYEGSWYEDEITGKGKWIWKNGGVYEGDCVNGIRHGKHT